MRAFLTHLFVWLLLSVTLVSALAADEKLKDIACRSVHLGYKAPAATLFYNEVQIEQSAPGTYFCVCGFNRGYFGLQELANGKKLVIFSVWDPGNQNDPGKVKDEVRVKLLHQGEGVRIGRFGNEGTGGQSFFDFDWKPNQTYRCCVLSKRNGERTEFAAYFYLPDQKAWKHLVTFSTITKDKQLGGYYSFVEDFRRNRESTKHSRRAAFGPGGVQDEVGKWHPLDEARFTADSNPVTNINAGVAKDRYFLVTGGETKNDDTPLNKPITLKRDDAKAPVDLPKWQEPVQK